MDPYDALMLVGAALFAGMTVGHALGFRQGGRVALVVLAELPAAERGRLIDAARLPAAAPPRSP